MLATAHDFRRLFTAQVISFAGDWFLTVPLLGLVYERTGSSLATAAVLAAQTLPALVLTPITGAVADRFDRKKIMVLVDVIRAVLIVGFVLVDDGTGAVLPIALMAAISAGGAFFYPASNGALPNLVDDDQLTQASVLMSLAWGTTAALGAALGGQVGAVLGRDAAFLIDAASFAVGAALVVRIRRPFSRTNVTKMPGFVSSARETLGYARRHGPVAALLSSKFSFGLTVGAIAMFPILSSQVFDAGDKGTGLLFAARGLGVLVGPLLARRFFGKSDARLLSIIGPCITLWGVSYLLMSISTSLAIAAVLVGIAHMGGGSQWTFSTYGLQRLVPDHLRGRVFGFDYGLLSLSASISNLLAGLAAEHLGARMVVAIAGGFAGLFGLGWAAVTRRYWRQLEPTG